MLIGFFHSLGVRYLTPFTKFMYSEWIIGLVIFNFQYVLKTNDISKVHAKLTKKNLAIWYFNEIEKRKLSILCF